MAEAALFSLTVKILSTIALPAFKKAYGRVLSIWEAREDLEELKTTVQTIQASLRDAERRAEASAQVKDWIERTMEVLYEADDLFDEVATNDLRKQQKRNNIFNKVLVPFSKLNPITSNDSIAKKVKSIRENLAKIRADMGPFHFVECEYETSISSLRRGVESGWYVDPKEVLGRKDAKEKVRGYLLDEINAEISVPIIAIVGIGGMGKTTLAQLVYSDEDIKKTFGNRWWTWISKTFDDKEVIGKIFDSMTGEPYKNLSTVRLESGIRECVNIDHESVSIDEKSKRFLLVLDDLWEEDHARAMKLRSLLTSDNAKGSRILVTTRSKTVAEAMEADRVYEIDGLSWDASWELFKCFAFTPDHEKSEDFNKLGKAIVKKCANVPLAIKSIASLLYTKATIEDWSRIEKNELSKIELTDDSIMSALMLSYIYLPSHLKQCFAYCYLFPKDYVFCKKELVYLWIAQGYVKQDSYSTIEDAGDACFMELLQRSFFQGAKQDKHADEVISCKMHSLMHDLAQRVAGDEFAVLAETDTSRQFRRKLRHLSVGYETDVLWHIPPPLLECGGLRSSLFKYEGSLSSLLLDELPVTFKFLRALNLGGQKIAKVPSSIGDLRHVRYLNLSYNKFTELPDSMTKLVNLHTLDIRSCQQLEALPTKFRKLTNLVHLDNEQCMRLRHMPPRFRELSSLRCLTYFKVGKAISGGKCSWLDEFARLKLTGELTIRFDDNIKDWNGETCWQLPSTIQVLAIENYPGMSMPHWGQPQASTASLLCKLQVSNTLAIKFLPPFKLLPNLKALELSGLDRLEYVEGGDRVDLAVVGSPTISLPNLEELKLSKLPILTSWSKGVEVAANKDLATKKYPLSNFPQPPHQMPSLPRLLDLEIKECQNLNSMPLPPCLEKLYLDMINKDLIQQLLSSTTPYLKSAVIWRCDWLEEFPGGALNSLRFLEVKYCNKLLRLELAPQQFNLLEELVLDSCSKLVLWGEERSVIWDSLPKLRVLSLDKIPTDKSLPSCLQDLQSRGQLEIKKPILTELDFGLHGLFVCCSYGALCRLRLPDSCQAERMPSSPILISASSFTTHLGQDIKN
ncbi:hypothetical protein V2J09_010124 [Rumex salicifolius]